MHCIENFLTVHDFWATCACPEKTELPWNFSLYWIYFLLIRSFEQLCACPEKQSCTIFTVLNMFFTLRIFEQPVLSLKNRVCPEILHSIEYTFYIQDFWATCACPENRVALEFFTALKYLLSFAIFEQIVLALTTEFALTFFKSEAAAVSSDPPPRTPMDVEAWKMWFWDEWAQWHNWSDQLLMWRNAAYSVYYTQREVSARLWNAKAYSRSSTYCILKVYTNITL